MLSTRGGRLTALLSRLCRRGSCVVAIVPGMTTVRRAGLRDVPGVYRICLLTGAAGEDATARHTDPDLLGWIEAAAAQAGDPEGALTALRGALAAPPTDAVGKAVSPSPALLQYGR